MSDKREYIIKGTVNSKTVYFIGFEKQIIHGKEWNVRKYSNTIVGSTIYSNYSEAIEDLKKLTDDFKIFPICPLCYNEHSEIDGLYCPLCKAKKEKEN